MPFGQLVFFATDSPPTKSPALIALALALAIALAVSHGAVFAPIAAFYTDLSNRACDTPWFGGDGPR
ncbi:hypothetical protein [Saccharopolyspora pogona]|uniref:hypothetical protein n=1 Tax=Saccharopolyspora pogona TaxID=333966 RepID=UPI00168777DA|nr:hypothetical protein [Saccharopolyspora pogona]